MTNQIPIQANVQTIRALRMSGMSSDDFFAAMHQAVKRLDFPKMTRQPDGTMQAKTLLWLYHSNGHDPIWETHKEHVEFLGTADELLDLMNLAPDPDWVTIEEAAEIAGVTPQTILQRVNRGSLKPLIDDVTAPKGRRLVYRPAL